ncbi:MULTISPECIES: M23 family metallopeptidase [Paenibacillus]|uniref:M23 family metallopeptidase n=1 Tax=Paenibacillus TaxID=44249 RepID=UPI0022B91324|nr:M23 family metallopeptidase [Paenibacillus caseinilyticus]MCZ8524065.1 M23 family metallopeptidase [Paenibacillus caseinilyticus]
MNVFKGMERFKDLMNKLRGSEKRSDSIVESAEVTTAADSGEIQEAGTPHSYKQTTETVHKGMAWRTVSAAALMAAIVWSGHQYVEAGMADYYRVYADGNEIGAVVDPSKIEAYKQSKREELSKSTGEAKMVVVEPKIELKAEKAFRPKGEEAAVLAQLDGYFSAYPVGVQLVVNGKPSGIVKDEATAKNVLEQIKTKAVASVSGKKEPGKVAVLSAPASVPVSTELQKADFVEQVEFQEVKIDPKELLKPEELQTKLETGNMAPTKYTVQEGDCVGCIAKKFGIPRQVIYQNNPGITDDMIKVGQVLDLTVLQPALSVRTVEKVVESQEIQHEIEYKQDDSMRLGTMEVISPGQNGMKKVTFELTKVNGLLENEALVSEEIVKQPVKEVQKKGTKVVKGEGTGKFAWPVASATVTSTFGTRWGALHKGIDLTGNRNIMAADNAKVVFAGRKDGYGNCIILDHLNGYRTLYGHLSEIDTETGKIVEKGEKIGYMGSTGDSTGVHLHFEVQVNESPQNPLKFLNR